jgi:hypothetical protein
LEAGFQKGGYPAFVEEWRIKVEDHQGIKLLRIG